MEKKKRGFGFYLNILVALVFLVAVDILLMITTQVNRQNKKRLKKPMLKILHGKWKIPEIINIMVSIL